MFFVKKVLFIIFISLFFVNCAFAIESFYQTYSEKNKFGIIKDDIKITEPIYNKLIRLGDSSWLFLKRNKYGIISNEGEILVEPKYTKAQRYASRFVKLGNGSKYALYDENGNLIIPFEYSSIEILYGKMFLVEKNYKYGLISFDGDIILAPVLDDIYMPKPSLIKLQYEGNWYEIEQKNKGTIELSSDIIDYNDDDSIKITQIIQNPMTSTALGVVSASDYFIKLFSSISPAYEQTIDELILNHGADTATVLMNFSWLYKFPFVYGKYYFNNIKAPNSGPLSDVKNGLKNKIK